jgi:integrase
MKGARPLSTVEILKVLRCCKNTRNECMIVIGFNLGLRISELLSLKWKDVLNGRKASRVLYLEGFRTKRHKSRTIPINRKAASAILRLQKSNPKLALPDNFLFPGFTKGHLGIRHVNRILYAIFNKAGLSGRLSSHCLRKTFATILADQGVNLAVIQELLGHTDISTTRKYIGVGMGNMTDAVKVLAKAY